MLAFRTSRNIVFIVAILLACTNYHPDAIVTVNPTHSAAVVLAHPAARDDSRVGYDSKNMLAAGSRFPHQPLGNGFAHNEESLLRGTTLIYDVTPSNPRDVEIINGICQAVLDEVFAYGYDAEYDAAYMSVYVADWNQDECGCSTEVMYGLYPFGLIFRDANCDENSGLWLLSRRMEAISEYRIPQNRADCRHATSPDEIKEFAEKGKGITIVFDQYDREAAIRREVERNAIEGFGDDTYEKIDKMNRMRECIRSVRYPDRGRGSW